MFTNINKTRGLEIIGEDIPQDENHEGYLLIKYEPGKREVDLDGTITQKVAVHNGIAYHVPYQVAQTFIGLAAQSTRVETDEQQE